MVNLALTAEVSERNRADAELKYAFNEIRQLKDRLVQEKLYLEEEISTAQGFEEVIGDSRCASRNPSSGRESRADGFHRPDSGRDGHR